MSNKLQLLLPTDIIADSVEKINNNFRVVLSAKSMENFSLTSYKRYIENKFSELKNNVELIGQIDFIFAKASFSKKLNGIKPDINNKKYVHQKCQGQSKL